MEPYSAVLVVDVAESTADAFDLLDLTVETFGAGIGDAGAQERFDLGPPGLLGAGQGMQFVDVGVRAPGENT